LIKAVWKTPMLTQTHRQTVTFRRPFLLQDVGRQLPASSYEVVTTEELIEGLSFPAYHRVATTMLVPAQSYQATIEMLTIDPLSLAAARDRDAAAAANMPDCVPAEVP
jgi:hypothetical protein